MPYIGHLSTAKGVKPDQEKIAAITNMEKPTDVKGLQRLLGMANYLTKFLENLSDICEPIRKLTHTSRAGEIPNGIFNQRNIPNGVSKVVKKLDCSSKVTCQNPFYSKHFLTGVAKGTLR
jgi:hypothetical protein